MSDIFDIFPGQQATLIAAACRVMRERGLTPDAVLSAYDDYMSQQMGGQIPSALLAQPSTPPTPPHIELLPGEEPMGTCPDCGSPAAGKPLCPLAEKPYKTRLACTSDDCGWWGKSTHRPAELRAGNLRELVEEQHHGNDGGA